MFRPEDPVWMVIDNEVVPGRFVEYRQKYGGIMAMCRYSDQSRWGRHLRGCGEELVFADDQHAAAVAKAAEFSERKVRDGGSTCHIRQAKARP